MLTTLFNAIQNALGSFTRGFLVVTFLPVILFLAANAAIVQAVFPGSLGKLFGSTDFASGVVAFLWILGAAAAALVLSSIQPLLFRLTEGDYLPGPIRRRWHRGHQQRLDALRQQAADANDRAEGFDRKIAEWRSALTLPKKGAAEPSDHTRNLVAALARLRARGEPIAAAEVNPAVVAMAAHLQVAGVGDVPLTLRDLRRELQRIIGYARDRSRYDYRQVQNRIQASFPGNVFDPEPSSDNILAPTAFGNIGRTIRSYALRRYGLDLDIFWNRLQKVMADSTTSKLFDSLQGQKTQLDFLVNLLWLTILMGAWIPVLAWERMHPRLFLAVASVVPALAFALYQTACRAYVVFADQVRTAVDYFRSDILTGLRVKLPIGTDDEERLWERLGDRIGYARKDATFLYVPKP